MADEYELDMWNAEFEDEVAVDDPSSLVVYSRDWTVETIFSQIVKGNIDLNPDFQRRNAWNDHKRSKLIESLIAGLPVPQIVLAEDKSRKGAFVIIDGKQRLLALSGFLDPSSFPYWDVPKLKDITTRSDLNGLAMFDFSTNEKYESDQRQFLNADIRCTIITGYNSDKVLYDIFYRLNSASVPLSSQELRQVLNRGEFTKLIMDETNRNIPLHTIMGLSFPDSRLRDAEILLRYIGIRTRGTYYKGNLSAFLEETLRLGNENWSSQEARFREIVAEFHEASQVLIDTLPEGKVGRKFSNGKWEGRFNRVLLEVEIYYFAHLLKNYIPINRNDFVEKFTIFCGNNREFLESIESTTKTIDRYYNRFSEFQTFVNRFFGLHLDVIPTPKPVDKNG